MKERLSRILLAIQALLILAPTSLLALYAAVFLLGSALWDARPLNLVVNFQNPPT